MIIDFQINCFLELITCSHVTTFLILHWKQFFFWLDQLVIVYTALWRCKAPCKCRLVVIIAASVDDLPGSYSFLQTYLTAVQLPLLISSKWLSFLSHSFRESSVMFMGFQLEGFFLIILNSHLIVLKRPRRETGQSYYYLLLLIIASINRFKSPPDLESIRSEIE